MARIDVGIGVRIGTPVGAIGAVAAGYTGPTRQAIGTLAPAAGAQVTVDWPAHQSGDIALLIVEVQGAANGALTTSAGFVEVTDSPQTSAGTLSTRLRVYWCRATSSAMASPIIGAPTNHQMGVIITFRGCIAAGDPWDVTSGGVLDVDSASVSITGDTTTAGNRLLVAICTHGIDSASAQFSNWLSGFTEEFDGGAIDGNGGGIGVATSQQTSAGAYGPVTATLASASAQAFMTIALKAS